jgi:monovalent cation/proton antiporter MnhG/PhaG subunit
VRDVVVAVLLGVAGLSVVISCLGVLVMRDALDRLHFTAPAGVLAPVAVAVAVLVEEPLSSAGIKAVIVAMLLIVTTPVLSHATARAARIREHGRWRVPAHEVRDSGEDAL